MIINLPKNILQFSPANRKLAKILNWAKSVLGLEHKSEIWSIGLPSGFSCPSALDCFAKAPRNGGKLITRIGTLFRCYSASQELVFKQTRNMVWRNFDLLRNLSTNEMVDLINKSMAFIPSCRILRIHASGDFFNEKYFLAWCEIARQKPDVIFYAYTKSLNFWVNNINDIPKNLRLIASRGGRFDNLIDEHNLLNALVVYSVDMAKRLNLAIDYDEQLAITSPVNFALLIHGVQSKEQTQKQQQLSMLNMSEVN
tara:strand:- start:281 stop:1045 length:765 start_codon:yes stop_codon:yes gene_type:complete